MQVATLSIPFAAHGTVNPGKQAWSVYVSNVYSNGATAAWGGTVWLVLNSADVVHDGTVSIDISSVLSAVGTLLQDNYGWHDFRKRYFLDSVPFGIEFGPSDGAVLSAGPSRFSLRLSSYCLEIHTTLEQAACARLSN
jgi:hypothetical protein